jgi:hypothetical protein
MSNYRVFEGLLRDGDLKKSVGSTYQDGRRIKLSPDNTFTAEELIEIAYAMKEYQRVNLWSRPIGDS